jgi:hypothetical protein
MEVKNKYKIYLLIATPNKNLYKNIFNIFYDDKHSLSVQIDNIS